MFAQILKKFDPDQPRAPAGSTDGGQWTANGGASTDKAKKWKTFDLFKRLSEKDGGFTYQPVSGEEPTKGFALSTYPQFSESKTAKELQLTDVVSYVARHKDIFAKKNHFLGAWHDPETDKIYFDISVVTTDKTKAERLAHKYDQIAYFDIGAKKSVTVNRNATSGGAAKGEGDEQETDYAARAAWIEDFIAGGDHQAFQESDGARADGAGDRGGESAAGEDGFVRLFKEWNEEAHPREPAGSEKGGQFASGDGGLSTAGAHDVVSAGLISAIESASKEEGGVSDQHGAGNIVDALSREHKDELIKLIDDLPKDKRPTILLHKGDLKKGIPTVWLLGWSKDEGTDIHDHHGSQVGVHVLRGEIRERVFGLPHEKYADPAKEKNGIEALVHERNLRAGSTLTIPDPYVHEVFGTSKISERDVTLHAYYPPLNKMTYYTYKDGKLFYDGKWDEGRPPGEGEKVHKSCACSVLEHIFKYSPDQPRAPSGTGTGGQWIAGGDSTAQDLDRAHARERNVEDVLTSNLTADQRAIYEQQRADNRGPSSAALNTSNGTRYTKERLAIHRAILDEFFKNSAHFKPEPGQKPELVVLAGRGGSGKSGFGSRLDNGTPGLGAYDATHFIRLDADTFKDKLAQADKKAQPYGGVGALAAHYHEESGRLFDRASVMARNMGLNTVLDVTMSSPHLGRLNAFKKAGYDTSAYLMYLPAHIAADRAMSRYKEGNQTGRLVPPEYILGSKNNERNFDTVKRRVGQWAIYSNDVPRGEAPRHVAGVNLALRKVLTGKEDDGFIGIFKAGTSAGAYKAWETIKAKYPEKYGKAVDKKAPGYHAAVMADLKNSATPVHVPTTVGKPLDPTQLELIPNLQKDSYPEVFTTTKAYGQVEPKYKDAVQALDDAHTKLITNMPPEVGQAVRAYTINAHRWVNKYLGAGKYGDQMLGRFSAAEQKSIKTVIRNLDTAVEAATLPFNVTLRRNMAARYMMDQFGMSGGMKDHPLSSLVGKTYTERGFASTTLNTNISMSLASPENKDRGRVDLYIQAPKGSKGLYVEGLTDNNREHEVILPRDSKFLISKVEPSREGQNRWRVTVKLVS